jgi:signal transduction histidine kinase
LGIRDRVRPFRALRMWPLAGPLGRRLLVVLLLLSLLPLAVSNAIGYLRSTEIIEDLVDRYLHGIAEVQVLHVSQQLERYEVFLKQMARDGPWSGNTELGNRDQLDRYLDEWLTDMPGFEALYLFSASGQIVVSAPLPPADLELWLGPQLREPHAPVEVVRDAAPPHFPRVRLSAPVGKASAGGSGLFIGGQVNVLGSEGFLKIPPHIAGSVESFIVDEADVPIFVSHPHGVMDFSVPLTTPLSDAAPGTHALYSDRQGVEVLGTTTPIPGRPWQLITEVPVSDALLELHQLRRVSLGLSLVLAVVIVVLALAIAGRIVAPVHRLVSATRRLADGDLGTRVRVVDRNEIGELGKAFNDLAAELARTSARVAEMHEQEIQRAGQLATVGELAAGVAHEIKNPIAGISGGIDLVMRYTPQDTKITTIVEEMKRQIARVHAAVSDLLTYARPARLELEPVDANEAVERAVILVQPTAHRVSVTIAVSLGKLLQVLADTEMIQQAVVNLIVNAVQACEPNGTVRVTTAPTESGIEIRVSDNGRGMSQDELENVFKPFYTTKHQGTGLGLSITQSIVQRHQGQITVQSDPARGTTFTIELPVHTDATRAFNYTGSAR